MVSFSWTTPQTQWPLSVRPRTAASFSQAMPQRQWPLSVGPRNRHSGLFQSGHATETVASFSRATQQTQRPLSVGPRNRHSSLFFSRATPQRQWPLGSACPLPCRHSKRPTCRSFISPCGGGGGGGLGWKAPPAASRRRSSDDSRSTLLLPQTRNLVITDPNLVASKAARRDSSAVRTADSVVIERSRVRVPAGAVG